MKVLVTGAGGLLGQKLIDHLSTLRQVAVVATANRPLPTFDKRVIFESLDLTDFVAIDRVMTRHRPDAVVHAAALTDVDRCEAERALCYTVNVEATQRLAQWLRQDGAHFIFISTDFVFDGKNDPLSETADANPVNYYGQCKLEAEQAIAGLGIPYTLARTAVVYGVGGIAHRANIVLSVKQSLEQGKRVYAVEDERRSPTLAEDLATACGLMLTQQAQGLFHVAGPEWLTPLEMAQQTARFFNLDETLIEPVRSATLRRRAQRPLKTGLYIQKAEVALGYRPHRFAEGLAITAGELNRLKDR